MKKRFSTGTVIALMLLVATATYLVSLHLIREEYNAMLKQSEYESVEAAKYLQAQKLIEENFIGEVEHDAIVDGAITGMVAATGDRWSYYLNAEDAQKQKESKESHVGIGVSVIRYGETELIRITQVNEDSPAKEAGIEVFDLIVTVSGQDIEEIGYSEAVEMIRGEENTLVELGLQKQDGSRHNVAVQRKKIQAVDVTSELINDNIGYVRISAFNTRVHEEFAVAVDNLVAAGAEGFIFDVRNNPGGELRALVSTLDKILPEDDIIIITRNKAGDELAYPSDEISLDMPMVVLVNGDSYSAAEFFAACLQEYGLAQVVGEKTVGKGYAQHALELTDGSYIHLSMDSYYTPKGVSLAGIGITPDYEVSISDAVNFYSPGHEGDQQFGKALDVITEKLAG